MQISSDINLRRRRDNLCSAFRASEGQRVRLHFSVLRSLVWFRSFFFFFQGVFLVCLLTLSVLSPYSFLSSFRRLQQEFRLPTWLCLRKPALTLYLWNPIWWLRMKFTTPYRTTTQNWIWFGRVEETARDRQNPWKAQRPCCEVPQRETRTEYSGSEAQNSKSPLETAEGIFDPSAALVSHDVA